MKFKFTRKTFISSLYIFAVILYGVIFLLSITQLAETRHNTQAIRETTASTNKLVAGQTDILDAIKQVTLDTKLTAEQQTDIIICMLQVPLSERTTDTANNCRKQAQTNDVSAADTHSETPSNTVSSNSPASSTNNKPAQTNPQPNNSQPAPNNLLLNLINVITNTLNGIGL